MKHKLLPLILMLLGLLIFAAPSFGQSRDNDFEVVQLDQFSQYQAVPGDVIVKFADGTDLHLRLDAAKGECKTGLTKVDQLLAKYHVSHAERLVPQDDVKRPLRTSKSYGGPDVVERDLSRLCLLHVELADTAFGMERQLIEELKELDEVEFAEPNYLVYALGGNEVGNKEEGIGNIEPANSLYPIPYTLSPAAAGDGDPLYSQQWGIPAVGLDLLQAVDNTYNGDEPIIAIIDTGVDTTHADLHDNLWTDPVTGHHGWDFVNQRPAARDNNGHGTHCAGIAAAIGDNGIGIRGANPHAKIMAVTVMQSNGTGATSTIIQGIVYAREHGANVISMSLGTYAHSIALEQALAQAYQTSVLVAAAGNDGIRIDPRCGTEPPDKPMFPAAYTFVLGVEATSTMPNEGDPGGYRASFTNWDCDGPSFSQFGENQLYNYELQAPGQGIMSTMPGGQYRQMNGTSMACPLVAGGVSALMHAKEYLSKELLFGDLIHSSNSHGEVDFMQAYNRGPAPAVLECVAIETNDTTYGDSDMRADANERIELYPTIRTTWGRADSIQVWIEFSEFEDPTVLSIEQNPVDFHWPLSAYAKSKSLNPIVFTVDSSVVDGRIISLVLCASSPNAPDTLRHPFTIAVENGVELRGMQTADLTLYPNVHYIVTDNYAIPSGITLTIKPGCVLRFKQDVSMSVAGTIIANGTPDSMITFTKTELGGNWNKIITSGGSRQFSYCVFEASSEHDLKGKSGIAMNSVKNHDLLFIDNKPSVQILDNIDGIRISYINNWIYPWLFSSPDAMEHWNFINNITSWVQNDAIGIFQYNSNRCAQYWKGNFFNNYQYQGREISNITFELSGSTPFICYLDSIYHGTAREDLARPQIWDFESYNSGVFGWLDMTNMRRRPDPEAHGIVWRVLVGDTMEGARLYDAQDEFELLPPLGMGTYRFDVQFSRPMDTTKTPMVAMGVRPPYTQKAIAENGHWIGDTIYSAQLTLTATSVTDGLNRIYVANAEDDEHFPCPYENRRFNVQVAVSGSLSAGFMATAGIGKVDLEWNHNDVDFSDFLGYNLYRYQLDSLGNRFDSVMLNEQLLFDTLFTDYNVTPGTRYYYYYKVLRTSLTENDPSKTVACVPLSAERGDANGNFTVDVTDVVTVIAYLTDQNPQPFLFDAADVNQDGEIDVLDVVGIIHLIMNPGSKDIPEGDVATAVYTIEDGVLYVNSPVDLGGVQFAFEMDSSNVVEVLESLEGFEVVTFWLDGKYNLLAFNMSGRTVPAGKTALLRIGEAELAGVVLSDPRGGNVVCVKGDVGIEIIENEAVGTYLEAYPNPFNDQVTFDFVLTEKSPVQVELTLTDMLGREVSLWQLPQMGYGRHSFSCRPSVGKGFYIATLKVNGKEFQRARVVKY